MESRMTVRILSEAGYMEALYGMGLSFGLTSGSHCWDELGFWSDGGLMERLEERSGKLAGKGRGHDKFLRQMVLWVDIDAPLFWWKEMDQYKVATNQTSSELLSAYQSRQPEILQRAF